MFLMPRLWAREITPADTLELTTLFKQKAVGAPAFTPQSIATFVADYEKNQGLHPESTDRHFMFYESHSGLFVGYGSLTRRQGEAIPEISVQVDETRQGSRFGSEIASGLADFAFRTFPFEKLQATALERNGPSLRMLGNAGFRRVGEESVPAEGRMQTRHILQLTRGEWELHIPFHPRLRTRPPGPAAG